MLARRGVMRAETQTPIEFAAVAHAVTIEKLGPSRSYSIEIKPLAMLTIIIGTMKGETREAPLFISTVC